LRGGGKYADRQNICSICPVKKSYVTFLLWNVRDFDRCDYSSSTQFEIQNNKGVKALTIATSMTFAAMIFHFIYYYIYRNMDFNRIYLGWKKHDGQC